MIKLYGAPLSNYYNMIKVAMLEKGIEFEEVLTPPSQEEPFLQKSPMGKIPCIETESGFLSESIPILEYLEEVSSETNLIPGDAFQRAKVREIAQALELHVELVARQGYGALRDRPVPDHIKDSLKTDLPKGTAALGKLTKFNPWIAGDQFSYADIVGYFSFILANRSAKANIDVDLLASLEGASAWYEKVGARESVQRALADQKK